MDVSKDWLDVAVQQEKRTRPFANPKKGVGELVRWMNQLQPQLIVVEATGGYGEALGLALFHANLPVASVSPQRVRQLDAQLLAEYGKAIPPR